MKIIRSSDIGRYIYCPVCWWIEEKEGIKINQAMLDGRKAHMTIANNASTARLLHVCMILVLILISLISVYLVIS